MKFDFFVNKNKIIIISFIVLVLFSFFNCNVFADTISDFDDSTVDYKIDNSVSSGFETMLSDFKNSKYYNSSDYYWFALYEYWARSNCIIVIKKSDCSLSDVPLYISDYEYSWRSFVLDFGSIPSSAFSYYCGNGSISSDYDIANHTTLKFAGIYDSSSRSFSIPFDTNFPKIVRTRSNNVSFDFFVGAPTFHLTEAVGQIPEIMTKIIKQVLPIGLIVLGIGLLIYSIRRVIFSMK